MRAKRVVADPSVLIRAALEPEGIPRGALNALATIRGVLLFSDETFADLRTQFRRPTLDPIVSREKRELYLSQLVAVSDWITITGAKMGCPNPRHDQLLETAVMGDAECVVTGNQGLLAMSPFQGIAIMNPTDFLLSGG